jgi:hypothetical protein
MMLRQPVRRIPGLLVLLAGLAVPIQPATAVGAENPPSRPAKAKSAAGGAQEKPSPEPIPPVKREDPAIEAILATRPASPSEWVRVGLALADLNRPELARQQFAQALAAKLDATQLAALGEEFGSAAMLKIAGRADLAPEGRKLADAVLAARIALARDPARIAAWVKDLQDPSPEKRGRAIVGLQEAQAAAVGPLLAVLADTQRAKEHGNVRAVLVRLGADAVRPLVAALDASDPHLASEAVRLLAALNAREAAPYLIAMALDQGRPEPVRRAAGQAVQKLLRVEATPQDGAAYLAREAQRYFDRLEPLSVGPSGGVETWTWDESTKQPVPRNLTPEGVSLILAARFAKAAHTLAPKDDAIRLLHLATSLELAAYRNGLDHSLPVDQNTPAGQAAQAGAEVVQRVLSYAMERNHIPAATAAARILGQLDRTQTEAMLCRGPRPAPLVMATRHPDRRLRFAAVEAIVRIRPACGFAGASYVVEAMRFFASTTGSPRVLIGSLTSDEAHRLGGHLLALGYQTDFATTGRELIRLGLDCPDYEMILIDAGIDHPTIDFLLQQLRRDGRTAGLPVGVLARAEHFARADRVVKDDPLAEAFARPHDEAAIRYVVDRLLARAGRDRIGHAQRQRQAALALEWLAAWCGDPTARRLYDLRPLEEVAVKALRTPHLSTRAVALLARLSSAAGQRALVDLASSPQQPIALRHAAVAALVQTIQQDGVLLTTEEIRRQYERYNQGAVLDAPTQQVLGRILDVLEAPAGTAGPTASRSSPNESSQATGSQGP